MKIFTLAVVFLLLAVSAQAWTFNHSYIDPNLIYNKCTFLNIKTPKSTKAGQCCSSYKCDRYSEDGTCLQSTCQAGTNADGTCIKVGDTKRDPTKTYQCATDPDTQHYTTKVQYYNRVNNIPYIDETCYHPSCYLKAIGTLSSQMSVQPLTNQTGIITDVVKNIQVNNQLNFAFDYTQIQSRDTNNNPNSYWVGEVQWPYNYYSPPGTSAMQGLLWSWRMLSPKWQGYWAGQSSYEAQYGDATSQNYRSSSGSGGVILPSITNTKQVIIISDGADTDGPDMGNSATPGSHSPDVNAGSITYQDPSGVSHTITQDDASQNPSVGFQLNSVSSNSNMYETCDAHVPIASIKHQNYIDVCNAMKSEGITVNVILYQYSVQDQQADSRLADCATATGGTTIKNATPATIAKDLADLLAAIASKNIRLAQ